MGIKNLIITMIVIGVVILLAVNFAYDMQIANSGQTSILDDNNTASLKKDIGLYLQNYSVEGTEVSDTYYNSTLKEGDAGTLYIPSQNVIQTKSWKTPFLIIKRSISYVYVSLVGNRGSDFAYIFGAVLSVIAITAIFYFIKFIRQGQE